MPGTFTQLYLQIVFAVSGRQSLVQAAWEDQLYRYITGVVQNKEQKMLAINGMPDHLHFLIGMKPSCCLSDLIREVKKSSNEFINQNKFTPGKFNWQEGYGAFSYSHSALGTVISYINSQKKHHQKKTFREEYLEFLTKLDIPYQQQYLFEWTD